MVALLDVVFVSIDPILSVLSASFVKCKVRSKERPHDGPSEDGHRIGSDQFPYERQRAVLQHTNNILAHQVQILLAHFRHLILHFASIVNHNECRLFLLRLLIELIIFVDRIEFLKKSIAGSSRKAETSQTRYCSIQNKVPFAFQNKCQLSRG